MRLIRLLIVLAVVVAAAAYVTRPGPAAFDAMLDAAIRDRVASTDIGAGGEALPTIALAACKLRPTDCVAIVRQSVEVTFEQRLFTTRARVEGFGRSTICTGAFTRFFCDRPVAG